MSVVVLRGGADSATTESPNRCSTIDAMLRALMLVVRASERPLPVRKEPTMLTASEVGSFVFCPEAWYLQRRGARQSAITEKRLESGIRAHREIGRETNRVLHVDSVRVVLLLAILVLAVVLIAQFAGATLTLRQ